MQRLIKCSSSRVQIKDSGLTYGADDETDHHFLLSKCRVGCTRRNNNEKKRSYLISVFRLNFC